MASIKLWNILRGCSMARIFKAEIYVVDSNDMIRDVDELEDIINENIDGFAVTFNSKEKELDWHDDIDLNYTKNMENKYVFENYFEEECRDE